jgi:hypothetical protein
MLRHLELLLVLIACGCVVRATRPDKARNPVADIWEPYIASVVAQSEGPYQFEAVRTKLDQMPQEFRIPYVVGQLSDKRLTREDFAATTGEPPYQQRVCDLAAFFITDYHPSPWDLSEIVTEPLFSGFWFNLSSPIEERDKEIRRILEWWQNEGRERFGGRSIVCSDLVQPIAPPLSGNPRKLKPKGS